MTRRKGSDTGEVPWSTVRPGSLLQSSSYGLWLLLDVRYVEGDDWWNNYCTLACLHDTPAGIYRPGELQEFHCHRTWSVVAGPP